MSVDLAHLIIDIKAQGVAEAKAGLDSLKVAGVEVEGQARKTTTATAEANRIMNQFGLASTVAAGGATTAAARMREVADVAPKSATATQSAARAFAEFAQSSSVAAGGATTASAAFRAAAGSSVAFAAQVARAVPAHSAGAAGAKLQAYELANLGRQFADVGVSAAMGMNPIMILVQQGTQIADVFATARARGVTFSSALKDIGGVVTRNIGMIAGLTTGLGLAAGAFAILTNAMEEQRRKAEQLRKDTAEVSKALEQVARWHGEAAATGGAWIGNLNDQASASRRAAWAARDHAGALADERRELLMSAIAAAERRVADANSAVTTAMMGGSRYSAAKIGLPTDNLKDLQADANSASYALGQLQKAYYQVAAMGSGARRGGNPRDPGKDRPGGYVASPQDTKDIQDATTATTNFGRAVRETGATVSTASDEVAEITRRLEELQNRLMSPQERAAAQYAKDIETLAKAFDLGALSAGGLVQEMERLRNSRIEKLEPIKIPDLSQMTTAAQAAEDFTSGLVISATDLADELRMVDQMALNAGRGLEQAFGSAGGAIGGIVTSVSGLRVELAAINREELARNISGTQAARARSEAQVRTYGDMAAAAKSFFKEGSTGYRVMQAVEAGYRAFQLQSSIIAMAADARETASSVANATVRGSADSASGVAKIFGQLGMFAFPVAAAAIAFMASAGVNARGGGGGASFDLQARQDAQGTGSVLGDPNAKSDSLARAFEDTRKTQDLMVGYQNSMVAYLRSIDSKIGAFATVLARNITGGQLFSTNGLNLGSVSGRGLGTAGNLVTGTAGALIGTTIGGTAGALLGTTAGGFFGAIAPLLGPAGLILGALAPLLFSSKTTRTLQDQGLSFPNQTVGDIMSNGVQGSSYQQVLENTKKKFLGITYSDKNRTSTSTTPLGDDYLSNVGLIIETLRAGILQGAGVLGLEGAQATLDSFQVALGDISLKDMTGEEIQETLNAVFGKLADDMASAVAGGLIEKYQVLGEGAFETMIRLANGIELVRAQFQATGLAFDRVGEAAVNASQAMIDAAGGMEQFASSMDFFRENFLSEQERMVPLVERVMGRLTAVGLGWVDTMEEFRQAGLDALAANDPAKVQALFDVQEDFLKWQQYEEKLRGAQNQTGASANAAADAMSQAASKWQTIADNLNAYSRKLAGEAAASNPLMAYKQALGQFNAIDPLVRTGDQSALDKFQSVGDAFIEAARNVATDEITVARAIGRVQETALAGERFARQQAGNPMVDVAQNTAAMSQEITNLRGEVASLTNELAKTQKTNADNVTYIRNLLDQVTQGNLTIQTEVA